LGKTAASTARKRRTDVKKSACGFYVRRRATAEEIYAGVFCRNKYPLEKIHAMFGKRKYCTPKDILSSDIPDSDKFWVLTHTFVSDNKHIRTSCLFDASVYRYDINAKESAILIAAFIASRGTKKAYDELLTNRK
jgi:hypothetical protein